jgi:homoserine O-acetyltransferase
MARMLLENGNDVTFCNIQSSYGHDAFLLEFETLGKLLHGFLTNIAREGGLPV